MEKLFAAQIFLLTEYFILTFYLLPASANFHPVPSCYDRTSACSGEYHDGYHPCPVTSSMKQSQIQCEISRNYLQTNLEQTGIDTTNIGARTCYPSSDWFCYQYFNLTWNVSGGALDKISYFQLQLSFQYLGEEVTLRRIMKITKPTNVTIGNLVTFSYSCHQMDYPGAIYTTFVYALDENFKTIFFKYYKFMTGCSVLHHNNKLDLESVKPYGQVKAKFTWAPKYKVIVGNGSVEVFHTMPDCKLQLNWSRLVLTHLTTKENTNTSMVQCVCPFTGSFRADNLVNGNYSVKLLLYAGRNFAPLRIIDIQNFRMLHGIEISTTSLKRESLPGSFTTTKSFSTFLKSSSEIAREKLNETIPVSFSVMENATRNEEVELGGKWFIIGGLIIIGWLIISISVFYYCRKSRSPQKINVCIRSRINSTRKDTKLGDNVVPHVEKKQNYNVYNCDSGIDSKCSQCDSMNTSQTSKSFNSSVPFNNHSVSHCNGSCKCIESYPRCSCATDFFLDLEMTLYPPSDDDSCSINSVKFKERIDSINSEYLAI